jgi:hypothetical protein
MSLQPSAYYPEQDELGVPYEYLAIDWPNLQINQYISFDLPLIALSTEYKSIKL